MFQGLTPSASYCEVHEHNFSHTYHLAKLSSSKEDIVVEYKSNEIIRMQLCSPLIKKCNGQDGYAMCLIKNNIEKGIGNFLIVIHFVHY